LKMYQPTKELEPDSSGPAPKMRAVYIIPTRDEQILDYKEAFYALKAATNVDTCGICLKVIYHHNETDINYCQCCGIDFCDACLPCSLTNDTDTITNVFYCQACSNKINESIEENDSPLFDIDNK
jgi:hypothetical protein